MRYHGEVRIVCPSCAAAYDVAEAALAPGRAVRCARCGVEWAPVAAVEQPDPPIAVPPAPSDPIQDESAHPASPGGTAEPVARNRMALPAPPDTKLLAAWLASVLLLLLLAWGAYAGRASIMAAWPPSERLYRALGVAVPHPAPAAPQNGLSKR